MVVELSPSTSQLCTRTALFGCITFSLPRLRLTHGQSHQSQTSSPHVVIDGDERHSRVSIATTLGSYSELLSRESKCAAHQDHLIWVPGRHKPIDCHRERMVVNDDRRPRRNNRCPIQKPHLVVCMASFVWRASGITTIHCWIADNTVRSAPQTIRRAIAVRRSQQLLWCAPGSPGMLSDANMNCTLWVMTRSAWVVAHYEDR